MTIKSKEDSLTDTSCDQESLKHDEQHLYNFVNTMLKGRLFIGNFQEKRYVTNLKEYRDVIVVSGEEKELLVDLDVVKKRLGNSFKGKWIGITTPKTIGAPAGYCMWVDLPEEVFGRYWYKIRSVSFRKNEILLKIKPVRAISLNASLEETNTTKTNQISSQSDDKELTTKPDFNKRLKKFISDVITWENVKETTKFLILLTGTVFVALIEGGKYFAEFSLKLTREFSNLIKVLTPFAIACLGFCEKIVGGFYLLLAMIFRDFRKPQPSFVAAPTRPMLTFTPYRNVQRRYGQSVRITEM